MSALSGVHPVLIDRAQRILAAFEAIGHPMMVTAGVRTVDAQHALWRQGRDLPGRIVTHADGFEKKSNHQVKSDGVGYAVDMVFLRDGHPSWAEDHPWDLYGAVAKTLGLRWGGDFTNLVDRPHIELPSAHT